MKFKYLIALLFLSFSFYTKAQISTTYRGERDKKFLLKHTKLSVDFNFDAKTMNGEAWITLAPKGKATNILQLDAKFMEIYQVTLEDKALAFDYDNYELTIKLPKTYQQNEAFTVYIKYLSQPEKVKDKVTGLLTDAKGLYFVNNTSSDLNTKQIWTHGETQANSSWMPTIDSPNQKTTQEFYITVPKNYKTISNGRFVSGQVKGNVRTDYWKLDKKHAPYLAFFAVGEFEIVKGKAYKDIPVEYYVDKKNKENADAIFGLSHEMLTFYESKFGIKYPWSKLSHIVVSDFVSGAMENTSAIVYNENAYLKPGQLVDKNTQETVIAHAIAHQWFGNLVTAESWSNVALNESLANYAEYLWLEHKYGAEEAEMHLFNQQEIYKQSATQNLPLVRFTYDSTEELFNPVTYSKGGLIFHMLRKYLGDDIFFEGLKSYLEKYQFNDAEVHQLRLVFEELTGKDLNWFFNQWFFGANHPDIDISYDYNTLQKTVTINLYQYQQEPFQFPFTIDIFEGNKRTRHEFFVEGKDASFTFPYQTQPKLIQVNADNALLCQIRENKVLSDYLFQLKNATSFSHRRAALLQVVKKQDDRTVFEAVVSALNDKSPQIRILALENIDLINKFSKKDAINKIMQLAESDPKTMVRAAAIGTLGKLTDPELINIFAKGLQSESFSVLGNALISMYYVNKELAIKRSKELPDQVRQMLATPLTRIFLEEKDKDEMAFVAKNVVSGMFLASREDIKDMYKKAFEIISESNNMEAIENVVEDMVLKGNQFKQFGFDKVAINLMRKMIQDQKRVNLSNRERNIAIIKTAMEKLL